MTTTTAAARALAASPVAAAVGPAVEVASLARVRHGVRAVLALGIVASLGANIAHAQPSVIGRLIAGWSPVALALGVELVSRVPVTRSWRAAIRWTATAVIAGIAAWVSYWHMVSVATQHGETAVSAHLIPVSVDGLVVVASVSLVEITHRLRLTGSMVGVAGAPTTAEDAPVQAAASKLPDVADQPAPPSQGSPLTSSAASPDGSSLASPRASSFGSSSGSSSRASKASSGGSSGRSPRRLRRADDDTLRALVAQARAERRGAGEPAVRRLLSAKRLSASSARVRAALAESAADVVPAAPAAASSVHAALPSAATEDDAAA